MSPLGRCDQRESACRIRIRRLPTGAAHLLAGCVTQVKADACSSFFVAATPPTGSAPTDTPWHNPEKLFTLLDVFYPVPKGKNLRPTPFMPYLNFPPSAWILPLKFTGGGLSGPGKRAPPYRRRN